MIFIIIFLAEDAKVAHMQDLLWQPDSGCSWDAITRHIPGKGSQKLKIVQKKGQANKMSGVKLKPALKSWKSCPFCGKKVNSVKGYGGIQFFECTNKRCGAMVSFRKYIDGKSEVEKWNERK